MMVLKNEFGDEEVQLTISGRNSSLNFSSSRELKTNNYIICRHKNEKKNCRYSNKLL